MTVEIIQAFGTWVVIPIVCLGFWWILIRALS